MRITKFKYYPQLTGSIIGQSCRVGLGSASKSGSTIGCGATISPATGMVQTADLRQKMGHQSRLGMVQYEVMGMLQCL